MKRYFFIKSHKFSFSLFLLGISTLLMPTFTSCFTGIEGTKKINLSREDRKNSNPSPEERFMAQVESSPLKDWEPGKRFIVTDDKALLVFVPQAGMFPSYPQSIKGENLEFQGVQSRMNVAGKINVALQFSDGTYLYVYDTGKDFDSAMEEVKSDRLPMLIDEDMVAKARSLLTGNKFWSRTNLWYDSLDNRISGRKYVDVTITEVLPGNMVFPLHLKIKAEDGSEAFLWMNMGNDSNDSRSFHNLFSLSDIRKHYPAIEPETWEYISRGDVKIGMTKDECKLALGNPVDLNSGHDYSQTIDIWTYENGRVLWFEDGRLVRLR